MRQCPTHSDQSAARWRTYTVLALTLVLLGLTLALPAGAFATAGWTPQSSGTAADAFEAVAFANARHGWVVGSGQNSNGVTVGIILATTNGGATWKRQYSGPAGISPEGSGLNAVAFANARHGWVVGDSGIILATTNGGAT